MKAYYKTEEKGFTGVVLLLKERMLSFPSKDDRIFYKSKYFDLVNIQLIVPLKEMNTVALVKDDYSTLFLDVSSDDFKEIATSRFMFVADTDYDKTVIVANLISGDWHKHFFSFNYQTGALHPLDGLNQLNLQPHYSVKRLNDYLVLTNFRVKKNTPFHFVIYDIASNSTVCEISEELGQFSSTHTPIHPLHIIGHTLIAGWNGNYHAGVAPRLLSIDFHTKEVKDLVLLDEFIRQPIQFPHNGCSNLLGALSVISFVYDKVEHQLVSFLSTGLYRFDLATMSGSYTLYPDELLPHFLMAGTGSYLYGDHFYFTSAVRGAFQPDVVQNSLGAFNIRTGKLDWHYHFPADYQTISLYTPQANDQYIVARDAESRIHIFEKQNHTL